MHRSLSEAAPVWAKGSGWIITADACSRWVIGVSGVGDTWLGIMDSCEDTVGTDGGGSEGVCVGADVAGGYDWDEERGRVVMEATGGATVLDGANELYN